MQRRKFTRTLWLALLVLSVVAPVVFVSSVAAKRATGEDDSGRAPQSKLPETFDVRGPGGVPRGPSLHAPVAAQTKALRALQTAAGVALQVRYNGLTGTP